MKKNILILITIILSALICLSLILTIKYKHEINNLHNECVRLNAIIAKIDSANSKLAKDKVFFQEQYEDLKSTKNKAELISVEIQECMKACNYTTACMNSCVYKSIPQWEKEIDKNIELLEKIMNKEQRELLYNSQKKWLAYKESQQKLNAETIGTMIGTIYTNILAANQQYIIELRAKELYSLYYFYSKQ